MAAPLALADDFWMAAHDQMSGDCYLRPKPLGIGLGAALLCELVVANWINVDGDALYLHPAAGTHPLPDHDPATRGLLEALVGRVRASAEGSSRHAHHVVSLSVDEEIRNLENGAAQELVEQRLRRSYPSVVQEERRAGLFRANRLVLRPADTNVSGWPSTRIKLRLRAAEVLGEQDLIFAGLLIATGLESKALSDLNNRERSFLARQTQTSLRRALMQLVISAETAIGRLAMIR
jgi:hypothetical protein